MIFIIRGSIFVLCSKLIFSITISVHQLEAIGFVGHLDENVMFHESLPFNTTIEKWLKLIGIKMKESVWVDFGDCQREITKECMYLSVQLFYISINFFISVIFVMKYVGQGVFLYQLLLFISLCNIYHLCIGYHIYPTK